MQFNDRDVLKGAGGISKEQADLKAKNTYDSYQTKRRGLQEKQGQKDGIAALRAMMNKAEDKSKK